MTDLRRQALLQFRCPECNGFEFGSSEQNGQLQRHCHGHRYDGRQDALLSCRFTWPESDDWKVFVLSFASRDAYEAVERARRSRWDLRGAAPLGPLGTLSPLPTPKKVPPESA